jgi:hypothetical protein
MPAKSVMQLDYGWGDNWITDSYSRRNRIGITDSWEINMSLIRGGIQIAESP